MTLEGKDECFRRLEQVTAAEFERAGEAFADVCMGPILTASQEQCPVDTGTMRASGQACSYVEIAPGVCVVHLGYGGAASKYARRQHEELNYHHKVGKAKFLEDPIREMAPAMGEMVKARLAAKLISEVF